MVLRNITPTGVTDTIQMDFLPTPRTDMHQYLHPDFFTKEKKQT
jgi:hypothetical protein